MWGAGRPGGMGLCAADQGLGRVWLSFAHGKQALASPAPTPAPRSCLEMLGLPWAASILAALTTETLWGTAPGPSSNAG